MREWIFYVTPSYRRRYVPYPLTSSLTDYDLLKETNTQTSAYLSSHCLACRYAMSIRLIQQVANLNVLSAMLFWTESHLLDLCRRLVLTSDIPIEDRDRDTIDSFRSRRLGNAKQHKNDGAQ